MNINISTLNLPNGTVTNLYVSSGIICPSTLSNLNTTNITISGFNITNLTTTSTVNLTAATLNISGQTTLQALTTTNLMTTNFSTSNLTVTSSTITNLTATNITSTNLYVPSQPFHISYVSLQSIPHNTGTTVLFATNPTNSGISFASGVCTVTYAGWYAITSSYYFENNGSGIRASSLFINNNEIKALTTPAISGAVTYLPLSGIYKLAANDTIKLTSYQAKADGSTTPLNIEASNNMFCVVKIF